MGCVWWQRNPSSWLCDFMGGWQNYGPFLGTLNMRCRIIIGIQNGTIILTTTHMGGQGNFCLAGHP